MALPSYYSTGTATVAANGTAVTGQGTSWSGALRAGDLFGTHKGLAVRIASVNSNTSLTLAYPWPGAAQTAVAYEVQIVPDEARVQEQTRLLLEKLASGNLDAFAGLALAADRLPYATGAGQMALTPLTSFARTLLDDANASTAQSTLGISTFIKGLLDDADAAAARGTLGVISLADSGEYVPSGANANLLPVGSAGLYGVVGATNLPSQSGIAFWWVTTQRIYSNAAKIQTAYGYNSGTGTVIAVWFRTASADETWSRWVPLVPERGSNANGDYVRLADGTQICWSTENVNLAVTAAVGSLFRDTAVANWTFPAQFSTPPVSVFTVLSTFIWGVAGATTNTTASRRAIGAASFSGSAGVSNLAVGRWY